MSMHEEREDEPLINVEKLNMLLTWNDQFWAVKKNIILKNVGYKENTSSKQQGIITKPWSTGKKYIKWNKVNAQQDASQIENRGWSNRLVARIFFIMEFAKYSWQSKAPLGKSYVLISLAPFDSLI